MQPPGIRKSAKPEVEKRVAELLEGHPEVEVTVTRATQRHLEPAEGSRVWISHTNGARLAAPIRVLNG